MVVLLIVVYINFALSTTDMTKPSSTYTGSQHGNDTGGGQAYTAGIGMSSLTLTEADATTAQAKHIYDFTGKQDLIIVMDRSQSVSKHYFDKGKSFVRHLITFGVTLHKNYTRLALLTYAESIIVEFDFISSGSITTCELFVSQGDWEHVHFKDGVTGTNIMDVLRKAQQLFDKGRLNRPLVRQTLWLLTDAEKLPSHSVLYARQLRNENVAIYGAGVGIHLDSAALMNLTSHPADRYYNRISDWKAMLEDINNQVFRFTKCKCD